MSESSKISSDYVSDILDEIALEGLDGITAEALWMRLSVRPNFCFQIDNNSKDFLWQIVIQMYDVKFYEIPEARATLRYYNPTEMDNTLNAILELDEIYPYHRLKNISGVFGSCQYYSERIDITEDVIRMGLKEVEEKWGNKLVIVASQESRNYSLLGAFSPPNLDFSKATIPYDILERIGRSRYLGLATCGKGSIQSVVEDPKSIFHYLKLLFHHKLVKRQNISGNLPEISPNASKIYLTRFYEECLSDNMALLQIAIDKLKSQPNYLMPLHEFNELFDSRKKSRLKKLKKSNIFKKYISTSKSLPYRTLFPDASPSEWEKKCKGGEKTIRCVQLINPDVELSDAFEKDCDIDDEESPSSGFLPRGVFYENMSVIEQAYHHIKNSGSLGMSQSELVFKMGLNKKFVRNAIKRLISEKHCKFYIENDGRKRTKRCIVGDNIQTKEAATELVQILSGSMPSSLSADGKQHEGKLEKNLELTNIIETLNFPQFQGENMSYRTLRRLGMILKIIKINRFRLFHQITNYINEEEIKEGVSSRVDRVTVKKLLQRLETDQLIKKIILKGPKENGYVVKIYTDPSLELDQRQMDNLYHVHSSPASHESIVTVGDNQNNFVSEFSPFLLENLVEMKKMMSDIDLKSDKSGRSAAKKNELVYSPKFIRLHILHDLLFYLVYDYTGILDKSQEELMKELCKTATIDESVRKEMPTLYNSLLSSYMFVPPLSHSGKQPGWFLISDILIRMPLSVLVKMLNIRETTSDLWEYLNHPIRKHFLVKDLPLCVRQILFSNKNQMGYLYNEFKRLCFMGLLQYGPKVGREYFQTFVYLNKRASLLDTSTSPPAHYQLPTDLEFEVKKYHFETKNEVTKYWTDLFNICIGTNLEVKTKIFGKEVLRKDVDKESLKKLLEPKSIEQAAENDNGTQPGDNLGAGGLDSIMFSFLRSNWTGHMNKPLDVLKKAKPGKISLQKLRREHGKLRLLLKGARRRKGIVRGDRITNISEFEEKLKMTKFRKLKERDCRLKRRRKMSYDEIDLEALKLMNTLRVTWSTAEDNFLLICRVAMMFLCPNSRTFVKIPWSEVRRALQKNLPESKNKTQKAIARRIIYMLKNPTTFRSVNLCLEELKEIPEAVEKFDCSDILSCMKPSSPNVDELQNSLYEKFHDLVAFLKDRFIDSVNFNVKSNKDLIPDSMAELIEKFEFKEELEEPLTVKTIRENVIRAIFMSSLSCRADKTSSAVQLFDIYRQYHEDELQNAIKKLHADKVITLTKKIGNSVYKSGKVLPLSFTPYKLSFAFQSMLNMKYTHAIYPESYSQISKLQEKTEVEEFEVDLNGCNMTLFLLASKGLVFFRVIIPDQIIAIDSSNFTDATYSKMLQRYCQMLQFSGSNNKIVCSSGKIISRTDSNETLKDNTESLDVDTETEKIDHVKKVNERDREEAESVKAKKIKLNFEPDKIAEEKEEDNRKDDDVGEIPKSEVGPKATEREQSNCKMTRSSRVILYMMREEAKKEANNDSEKNTQETCVVNASKVIGKVNKIGLDSYTNERGPKAAGIIIKDILNRSLVPMNLVDENNFVEKLKENEEMKGIQSVLDFISSKKEQGATIGELNLNFQGINLSSIMKQMIDSKIVIKTGISETRFVSQKYSSPWLLTSFKITRLEREKVKPTDITAITLTDFAKNDSDLQEVPKKRHKGSVSLSEIKSDNYTLPYCPNNKMKIIIRPWIRIDGSLNRRVLDRFLGSILGFIMTNPGTTIQSIMNKFSSYITPVWTKDLIEILFDIGCVTFTSVVIVEKPSLFSNSTVQISDGRTEIVEDSFVTVEAKIDAVTTLGLFIGKTTYSKDFLVD